MVARRRMDLTRSAARVAIVYAALSAIWIAASDRVVEWLVTDPVAHTNVETLKGWFFVALTALLLYWALKAELARTAQATATSHRYQALAENARDIMLIVRQRDGQILEANPAAFEAYGCTRPELLGKTIFDLRAGQPAARVQAQMAQAAGGGMLFETEHRRADGTPFPVEVSSRGIELENEVVLVSVIRNVAERKAAQVEEKRLAAERDRPLSRLTWSSTTCPSPACSAMPRPAPLTGILRQSASSVSAGRRCWERRSSRSPSRLPPRAWCVIPSGGFSRERPSLRSSTRTSGRTAGRSSASGTTSR